MLSIQKLKSYVIVRRGGNPGSIWVVWNMNTFKSSVLIIGCSWNLMLFCGEEGGGGGNPGSLEETQAKPAWPPEPAITIALENVSYYCTVCMISWKHELVIRLKENHPVAF